MSNPTWKKQGSESRWNASPRARKAAMEILARWLDNLTLEQKPALDRIVANEFRQRKQLNAGERRWISEAVYGCVRFLRRQRFLLQSLGLPDTAESHIAIWAILPQEMTGTPPLVPDQWEPLLANTSPAQLEQALTQLPGRDNKHEYLRVTLSFPDVLADTLEALLGGDEAVDAGEAFNRQAPTTIRANPLRTTRTKLQSVLPDAVPTRYSPLGLELPRRVNLVELASFREGWFEVQEEASQLVTLLANPQPGQTVVDVGAGGGGKTLLLAALMQNRGRVVALDTSAPRLDALKKRAERAGVRIVTSLLVEADADGHWQDSGASAPKRQKLQGRADVVLLDAPCTGSGVLRRSPDAKWRTFDLADFARLQSLLLAQSAAFVAPNGLLVYVTCAFEREQNEAVIEAFLLSQPEGVWRIEPVSVFGIGDSVSSQTTPTSTNLSNTEHQTPNTESPYLRTWPHRHGLDAFFAACLRRHDTSSS